MLCPGGPLRLCSELTRGRDFDDQNLPDRSAISLSTILGLHRTHLYECIEYYLLLRRLLACRWITGATVRDAVVQAIRHMVSVLPSHLDSRTMLFMSFGRSHRSALRMTWCSKEWRRRHAGSSSAEVENLTCSFQSRPFKSLLLLLVYPRSSVPASSAVIVHRKCLVSHTVAVTMSVSPVLDGLTGCQPPDMEGRNHWPAACRKLAAAQAVVLPGTRSLSSPPTLLRLGELQSQTED